MDEQQNNPKRFAKSKKYIEYQNRKRFEKSKEKHANPIHNSKNKDIR